MWILKKIHAEIMWQRNQIAEWVACGEVSPAAAAEFTARVDDREHELAMRWRAAERERRENPEWARWLGY